MRTATVVLALLALLLGTLAGAQNDDRARQLLEGMVHADPWAGQTPETLEVVMVMTTFGAFAAEARTRTVIDYVGHRALIESELGGGMRSTIRLVDGRVTAVFAGEEVAMPPAMAALFDGMFDVPAAGFEVDDADVRYDGMRAYGDVVAGEQITLFGGLPALVPGIDAIAPELGGEIEVALLFDDAARVIAMVTSTADGPLLTVFDDPEAFLSGFASSHAYQLGPDGPELTMRILYESVRINEPIADGTF